MMTPAVTLCLGILSVFFRNVCAYQPQGPQAGGAPPHPNYPLQRRGGPPGRAGEADPLLVKHLLYGGSSSDGSSSPESPFPPHLTPISSTSVESGEGVDLGLAQKLLYGSESSSADSSLPVMDNHNMMAPVHPQRPESPPMPSAELEFDNGLPYPRQGSQHPVDPNNMPSNQPEKDGEPQGNEEDDKSETEEADGEPEDQQQTDPALSNINDDAVKQMLDGAEGLEVPFDKPQQPASEQNPAALDPENDPNEDLSDVAEPDNEETQDSEAEKNILEDINKEGSHAILGHIPDSPEEVAQLISILNDDGSNSSDPDNLVTEIVNEVHIMDENEQPDIEIMEIQSMSLPGMSTDDGGDLEECRDERPDCERMEDLCQDDTFGIIMAQKCAEKCGVCQMQKDALEEAKGKECKDRSKACFLGGPFCRTFIFSLFTSNVCPKTCGHCVGPADGVNEEDDIDSADVLPEDAEEEQEDTKDMLEALEAVEAENETPAEQQEDPSEANDQASSSSSSSEEQVALDGQIPAAGTDEQPKEPQEPSPPQGAVHSPVPRQRKPPIDTIHEQPDDDIFDPRELDD